jgi:drug/metabolite transporter (DMT)-like permease
MSGAVSPSGAPGRVPVGAAQGPLRTALAGSAAMVAFAANSLLCRVALATGAIDPAAFTALRLASGAAALWVLVALRERTPAPRPGGSWTSALALFAYAAPFSFAYLTLGAGTGALVLFTAVQTTMIMTGLRSGERPTVVQWVGLALALGGLVWLVFPGLSAPSPVGALLMVLAGVAWGVYSLRGRDVADPVAATAGNFARSTPFALALVALVLPSVSLSPVGIAWAVLSGALTSGLGYVAWYAAVRALSATRAAIVQLAAPVLAAAGGVVLLGESISLRLVLSGGAILGGVALAMLGRERRQA